MDNPDGRFYRIAGRNSSRDRIYGKSVDNGHCGKYDAYIFRYDLRTRIWGYNRRRFTYPRKTDRRRPILAPDSIYRRGKYHARCYMAFYREP